MENATLEHIEQAEHAEHAAHSGDKFTSTVSVTIAILAVVAASVGSLETLETAGAIASKNNAVLAQSRASDQWAFFQSKSLKKNLYEVAAVTSPEKQADFLAQAKRYDDEGKDIVTKATELEHVSHEELHQGEHHEHRHHVLTYGVTLLHVSIAIATIAIIAKGKKWPWYLAMLLACGGVAISATAYL